MAKLIRASLVSLGVFTVVCGLAYPLLVTGIAQLAFPHRASGSLIVQDGRAVGSELIGQDFGDPRYFWGRLSATARFPYNAASSSGTNLGPTNPTLVTTAQARIHALRVADPTNDGPIPVDLVTGSGSGLDPDISVAAALYQVGRVARERGTRVDEVRALVERHTKGRQLGFLGEPRVNVLQLNLALDAASGGRRQRR
jgi:potassium-transporting ATPase KdpC subunit